MEAKLPLQASLCGMCDGQSGTGRFFSEYFTFPLHNFTNATLRTESPVTELYNLQLLTVLK